MARDSQRSKVYEAQSHFHALCSTAWSRFDSISDCQVYVDSVTQSRWWKSRFPFVYKVRVLKYQGYRKAVAQKWNGTINLPQWAFNEFTILHELCHHTISYDNASHGREFCRNLLVLIKRFLGSEYEQTFRECFKITGVKWRKKRNLSPEQRAAMAERARANFGLT